MRYFKADNKSENRIEFYNLRDLGVERLEWIYLDQDRCQWRDVVKREMNRRRIC